MKLCWVTINVKDFEKSLDFYTKIVGLSIDKHMQPNENMTIAFLGAGETKVELIYDPIREERDYGKDITIGFTVDSIDMLMSTLKSRSIAVESGPHAPNPTIKFIFVRDPNGISVQFVENIKPKK